MNLQKILSRAERKMIAVNRHRLAIRKRDGLTLLELVIVVAILAIVAGFIIPTGAFLEKRAKYTSAKASLAAIRDAIVGTPSQPGYYSDTGQYPNTLEDLFVQPAGIPAFNRDTGRGWRGPYLLNANAQYKVGNSSDPSFISGPYPDPYGYWNSVTNTGDSAILDAWGNSIIIQWPTSGTPTQNQAFIRLISAGPNGVIDTPIVDSADSSETYYPLPADRGDDIVLFINHADSP
jgi:prepilin-type N-terminal cleavage/methylation domain-containing protein